MKSLSTQLLTKTTQSRRLGIIPRFYGLVFLLAIFLSSTALALDISMKKVYLPGETIIAEIVGPILEPIFLKDIQFKRENVAVPFEYDLKKIGENYFLWATAPESPGNYTFMIDNVLTTVNGKEEQIRFIYNFSIEGQLTEYSVKPGFIITSDDVEIEVWLNRDIEKNISLGQKQVFLQPGKNKFQVSLQELVNGERFNVGTYYLPVKLIGEDVKQTTVNRGLVLSPSVISQRISKEESLNSTYKISIKNIEGREIKDIYFIYDEKKFSIVPKGNFSLAINQTKDYNLTILNASNLRSYEEIFAKSNSSYAELLVEISFLKDANSNESIINDTREDPATNQSLKELRCSEIRGGRFCTEEQTCSGETLKSLDGNCCIGTCNVKEKSGSGSWIGYVLAIILVGILGYVYYNYNKTKKKTNADSFKKKVNEAEKKLP